MKATIYKYEGGRVTMSLYAPGSGQMDGVILTRCYSPNGWLCHSDSTLQPRNAVENAAIVAAAREALEELARGLVARPWKVSE